MKKNENQITLSDFYGQMAETHEAVLEPISKVQTKFEDLNKVQRRQMKKSFKKELSGFQPLQMAQQQEGTIAMFGVEEQKQLNANINDSIQQSLQKAGIADLSLEKRQKDTNFEDSSSESDGLDFQQLVVNNKQLSKQSDEIIKLRLRLKQNEAKLRRWAKIKSKAFRKIHNRERRAEKMQKIQEKLKIGIDAANAAGMAELAEDLVNERKAFVNGEELEIQQEAADGNQAGQQSAISRLSFVQNALRNDQNALLQSAQKNFSSSTRKLSSMDDNQDNFVVSQPQELVLGQQKVSKFQLSDKLELADEQNGQLQQLFQVKESDENEIQRLKEKETTVKENTILPGWGEWTGMGASAKDIMKHQRKVQTEQARQQQLKMQQWDQRQDKHDGNLFITTASNKETIQKFSAKGLNVTDEEYQKYLSQSLLPEYQTLANCRYQSQESVQTIRGSKILQEKELEKNVKELEKLQSQLQKQKKLIKGQRIAGGVQKNHFQ